MRRQSDTRLLQDADADPSAFRAFYRRHERAVVAFVGGQVRDPHVTVDVVAETFARAYASRRTFRDESGTARGWLLGIARHVLIESWRRGRVESEARVQLGMQTIALGDRSSRSVEDVVVATDDARVELWLADLPAEQREAVRRRILDDADYEQIAAELSCSEAVVRQRVSRGLLRLRKTVMEDQCP